MEKINNNSFDDSQIVVLKNICIGMIHLRNRIINNINASGLNILKTNHIIDMCGINFKELFLVQDEYDIIEKYVVTHGYYEGTHLLKAFDESFIWVHLIISLIANENEEKDLDFLIMLRDVTDEKKKERKLEYNIKINSKQLKDTKEEYYQLTTSYDNLYLNTDVGIFKYNYSTNKLIDCNPAFLKLFEYKDLNEAVCQLNLKDLYKNNKDFEILSHSFTDSSIVEFNCLLKKKDGSLFWGKHRLIVYSEKNIVEGFIYDISDYYVTKKLLEINEKKYRTIFQSLLIPVFIVAGDDFHIIDFNAKTLSLFQYSENEFKKLNLRDLINDDELFNYLKTNENILRQFDSFVFTNKYKFPIYANFVVYELTCDNKKYLCFNIEDRTQLELLNQKLKTYEQQFNSEMETQLSDFANKLKLLDQDTLKNLEEINSLLYAKQ